MIRNTLKLPDEYTAALCDRLEFDLSAASLATRMGKTYITRMSEIVSHISEGLTTNRAEFLASGYLRQKEIREAYTLYYMTTNLLKISQPLRELSFSKSFDNLVPLRILDLGTGTGAAIWGTLSYFNEKENSIPSEIMLTDSLQENLREVEIFSRYFVKSLPLQPRLNFELFDLRNPEYIPQKIKTSGPYHLITMMNVLNELEEKNDEVLLNSLLTLLDNNGSIIIVEPATRIESRRLLRFRDLAAFRNITIYSPCTRQANCPALANEDDWCHTDIAWERPPFIKAIDDIVGTLRLTLKSTYMILRKDGMTLGKALQKENLYRVVSERFDEKGRVRGILCGENGRNEHIINKRDMEDLNKDFQNIRRYDVVNLTGEEVREHDIRLPEGSKFSIVLPILGAR
ncbi:MAG: small ribosomal subunit Rsm22 family protein [Candidatus Kapaibacterium sp.]